MIQTFLSYQSSRLKAIPLFLLLSTLNSSFVLFGPLNVSFKLCKDVEKVKIQLGLVEIHTFLEHWQFCQFGLLVFNERSKDLFEFLDLLQERKRFLAHHFFESGHLVDPLIC